MTNRLRALLVPLVALSLAVGGLAYAAGDDSPVDVVQDTAEDTPETVVDDGVVQEDQPTDSGESDDEVTTTDDGTTDDGTADDGVVDDTADEAAPPADEEESHGPVRSTEGCPEGFSGNHGQYVSGTDDRPRSEAAHSPCGKPVKKDKDKTAEDDSGEDDTGDAPEGS